MNFEQIETYKNGLEVAVEAQEMVENLISARAEGIRAMSVEERLALGRDTFSQLKQLSKDIWEDELNCQKRGERIPDGEIDSKVIELDGVVLNFKAYQDASFDHLDDGEIDDPWPNYLCVWLDVDKKEKLGVLHVMLENPVDRGVADVVVGPRNATAEAVFADPSTEGCIGYIAELEDSLEALQLIHSRIFAGRTTE